MYRRYLAGIVTILVFLGLAFQVVSSAPAATIGQPSNTAFLAIYGSPTINGKEPVGGGLARNFGFGENMLFEASTLGKIGLNVKIVHEEKELVTEDAYIGGTLQSNRTGENNPLGFTIQFADFQDSSFAGLGGVPHYSDTSDRPWITTICAPLAEQCRVDPLLTVKVAGVDVKIEDVSLDIGGIVLQGTIWGNWINGKAKIPPCIKLENRPGAAGADQTLIDTQGGTVGKPITSIAGEFCLVSANNDWFKFGSIANEPPITIENK
jgi:hypothetical protein